VGAAALLGLLVLPSVASAGYSDTVRAWWPIAEGRGQVVRDWSGNGNHGQLGSTSAVDTNDPTWVRGIFGTSALRFDGNDFVRVPDSPALKPQQLTLSAWVKASGTPGTYRYVIGKGGDACVSSSYALWTGYNGGLGFYVWNGEEQITGGLVAPERIWDGRWHHVAGTWDGANAEFYVDGKPSGGSWLPADIDYGLPNGDTGMGNYLGACDLFFTGDIDQVTLFSQALPMQDIWNRWRWLLSSPKLGL
jgi:Concanavalin A-like lectin/glucanases superfamily